MTLRDLTDTERKKLQRRCLKEWERWAKQNPQDAKVTAIVTFQSAWSNGLKAGLEFATK